MKRLAKNLKLIRKGKWKMSQEKFADLMDSTRSKVNSYENNNIEPNLEYMIKLQNFSGLNVEDIYYNPLSLEEIPVQPLSSDAQELLKTSEELVPYDADDGTELRDYDYRIKKRFSFLEQRLKALEMQLLPDEEELEDE